MSKAGRQVTRLAHMLADRGTGTFLRSPTEVIAALETADVELERRDAPNVVLTRSERLAATTSGMATAAHVLRALARRDPDLASPN